tara:strand:+ start:213 stop:413 length:201 start_codon:yes stop_codon:yes gene_type:complete
MDHLIEMIEGCPDYKKKLREHLVSPMIRILYEEMGMVLLVGGGVLFLNTLFIAILVLLIIRKAAVF